MRVLLIKTSSLGDVVHALPAVTDACENNEELEFDWVVEEAFADIPSWHPCVKEVIPIAWRRWRKTLGNPQTLTEIKAFRKQLRTKNYDLILDAQGLIKSAVISRMARGRRVGLDRHSAREPIASFFYQDKVNVQKNRHAISRLRELFAKTFAYDIPNTPINYGINKDRWQTSDKKPYVVFIHGTTWVTKLWPESFWQELCDLAAHDGYEVHLPWGNDEEQYRATRIAEKQPNAKVLDRLPLGEIGEELANASAVIGVDSGLTHIAAALGLPTVAIYGATNAELTGVQGQSVNLHISNYKCAPCLSKVCFSRLDSLDYPPCYQEINPVSVWRSALSHLETI
jgi:heptosyltransferase-1